jgi:hypothetical protein
MGQFKSTAKASQPNYNSFVDFNQHQIQRWRLYCQTERKSFIHESEVYPCSCPNDDTHRLDHKATRILPQKN